MPNFCHSCGRSGSVDGTFCRFCGARFRPEVSDAEPAPTVRAARSVEQAENAIEILSAPRRFEYSLTGSRRYDADAPARRNILGTLAALVFVALALYLLVRAVSSPGNDTTSVVRHAFAEQIGQTAVAVDPRSFTWIPVDVRDVPLMHAYLGGYFEAEGGSGNDIDVMLVDSDGLMNLRNGHSASVFYNSGKVTIDHPRVGPLPPGLYYVIFSNTFSIFTNKAVQNHLEIDYAPG